MINRGGEADFIINAKCALFYVSLPFEDICISKPPKEEKPDYGKECPTVIMDECCGNLAEVVSDQRNKSDAK